MIYVFFRGVQFEIVEGNGKPSFPFHSHHSFLVGIIKFGSKQSKSTIDKLAGIMPEVVGRLVKIASNNKSISARYCSHLYFETVPC